MYENAQAKIREDPNLPDPDAKEKKGKDYWKAESKKYRTSKLSHAEKRDRVKAKIQELQSQ